jgi:hypothetical protein
MRLIWIDEFYEGENVKPRELSQHSSFQNRSYEINTFHVSLKRVFQNYEFYEGANDNHAS